MPRYILVFITLFYSLLSNATYADTAISDGAVSISEKELKYIISRWNSDMRRAAANDLGDRLELLSAAVASRKMAAELEALDPEVDASEYQLYQNKLLAFQRQYRVERYMQTLQMPDMEDLARETYQAQKDKYASVPEKRLSSHILFKCFPGECEREPLRLKAAELIEQLRNGADFEAMVAEYSDDPGTAQQGGRFDRWMQLGEIGVAPNYSGGVFSIDEVGGYSEAIDSRFGIHIIRLDEVQPKHYLPYEDVREKIVADLEGEYKKLALKDFQKKYRISDDAYINGDIVDKLFEQYKTQK